MVVVLVVENTADNQEGGWSTLIFLFLFLHVFIKNVLLEIFTTHLAVHCFLHIFFSLDIQMNAFYTFLCGIL